MRIQHNISAMNAYRNFNINNSALNKNLEKLSSGYRINRAGDDAAGLSVSEKMRSQITGYDTAEKNVKDGISMVKTAEGALQEVSDMLVRIKELATQSATGTYQTADRTAMNAEVSALKSEITRIGTSTKFNGISVLNANANTVLQIGDTGDTLSVTAINLATKLNSLTNTTVDTAGNAQTAMQTIDSLVSTLSGIRGDLGAVQNRLEHTQNNLNTMVENLQDAESTIRDTDVAEEMMAYTKNNILIQSAQAMLAQANQVPQGVLQLMQ